MKITNYSLLSNLEKNVLFHRRGLFIINYQEIFTALSIGKYGIHFKKH